MKKGPLLIFGVVLILVFGVFIYSQNESPKIMHITGTTMGSIQYNVKYIGDQDLINAIEKILVDMNQALSTYIPDSEISELNRTGDLTFRSTFFHPILKKSKEIFIASSGTFDPSIGPLVQAWGFGPDQKVSGLSAIKIDSILSIVGFSKVEFTDKKVSVPAGFQLDFSAIAKGYAVDLVAELLEKEQLENFLVEIGGEVRCKGHNEKLETWSLGIEDPLVEKNERKLIAIARLKDKSLATSGNYRNYYQEDGEIRAHIIDPRTGYTRKHNLLSASVFANDCATADAFATAFMVLGLEESYTLVESRTDLDAILIYKDENGAVKSLISDGIKPFIELIKTDV